jgi:hypothetical protein
MSFKQLYIALLLFTAATNKCMETQQKEIHQLALIKPFFNKLTTITKCIHTMDDIENKGLSYPDYDKRTGCIFSEFWVKTQHPEKMQEIERRKIRVLVDEKLHDFNAESSFDYPHIQKIIAHKILPKTFQCIEEHQWAPLPKKVFIQFFLQRCHIGNAMDWHQDPGPYYDLMADYALVLMLGKQDDPEHGWIGGEFKIKTGLPADSQQEINAQTIIHEQNQAVLFNNLCNSHAVTAILSAVQKSKRDIIVVHIFFKKQPIAIGDTADK